MTYSLIVIPLIALLLSQLLKVIIEAFKGNFSLRLLNAYGGMPSSHTALVAALCAEMAFVEGFKSAAFAVSLAFAILVIRDATGFRWYLGNHGKILNMLIDELPAKEERKFPHLEERLGHKPLEVLGGIVVGVLISLVYHLFFA